MALYNYRIDIPQNIILAWYLSRKNDNVLPSAVDVIMLYFHIHSDSKFAERSQAVVKDIQGAGDSDWKVSESDQHKLIQNYIEYASDKSMKIHSALQSYLEACEKKAATN